MKVSSSSAQVQQTMKSIQEISQLPQQLQKEVMDLQEKMLKAEYSMATGPQQKIEGIGQAIDLIT